VRLYVGIITAKQGLGPFDGEDLDGISEFNAAVVAPMGISLNGLVDQYRTQRILAWLTIFSEAISSIPSRWRDHSPRIAA